VIGGNQRLKLKSSDAKFQRKQSRNDDEKSSQINSDSDKEIGQNTKIPEIKYKTRVLQPKPSYERNTGQVKFQNSGMPTEETRK
jgi:hypothetical protein